MAYRNAPHSTTSASPASLLIGRQLRTRLDLLNPTSITNAKVLNSQSKTMDYESSRFREFSVGDTVLVRDYRSNQTDKWQNAIITDRLGPLSYRVQVPSEAMPWKRHVDQIVSGYEHNVTNVSPPDSADTTDPPADSTTSVQPMETPVSQPNILPTLRRSDRIIKKPKRLIEHC